MYVFEELDLQENDVDDWWLFGLALYIGALVSKNPSLSAKKTDLFGLYLAESYGFNSKEYGDRLGKNDTSEKRVGM